MLSLTAGKGIILSNLSDPSLSDIRELPWLAYPSFAPTGHSLAAEHYLPAEDPQDAELWGVVVYNADTDQQVDVAEGASQPAWRPGVMPDAVALRYAQPGEVVVTLDPPLRLNGKTYQVSYFTTGDLRRRSAGLFKVFTPDFFKDQQITGLLVNADGQVVTDLDELRRIFILYRAAYALYEDPPSDLGPPYKEELDKILTNPLIMAMEPEHFLSLNPDEFIGSRRSQTTEALRTLLSHNLTDDPLNMALDQALAQTPATAEEALTALRGVMEDQYATQKMLGQMSYELGLAYQDLDQTVGRADTTFKLLRLLARVIFIAHLQEERAGWLEMYADAFPSGDGSLDRDQLRAAVQVLDEAQNSIDQRVAVATDIGLEFFEEGLLNAADRLGPEAAASLVETVGSKYGLTLSSHTLAGALSAVSVGLTANSILYGTDTLVAQFKIAQRSEELRTVFGAGRQTVQQAAADAFAEESVYDGTLAERFRVAYLLEALTAIQTQRAYADGVAGTFQLPNPLEIVNWLRGEDWRSTVDELRFLADELETDLLATYVNPGYIDTSIALLRPGVEPLTISAPVQSEDATFLDGTWEGSYVCGQGITSLRLIVTAKDADNVEAIFSFSAHPSNPNVPSGRFTMKGAYDPTTSILRLVADKWLERPANYDTVDLSGELSDNKTTYSGQVLGSNCSTFEVTFIGTTDVSVTTSANTPMPILPAESVASYPFSGNANDVSGNENHGTVHGATLTEDRFGNPDSAYYFDGVNDYIEISPSDTLDTRNSISLFAWIHPDGSAGPILNYCTDCWGVHLWQVEETLLFVRFVTRDGEWTTSSAFTADVLTKNQWAFVGTTYDSSTGKASLWYNGQEVETFNIGPIELATQHPIRIGIRDGDNRFFTGAVDEITIFNDALTSEEIVNFYDASSLQSSPSDVTPAAFDNSPEGVVRKMLDAIVKEDQNQYLDALDPDLRDQPGYFFAQALVQGVLGHLGLSDTGTWTKVDFRDLVLESSVSDSGIGGSVHVSGKIRNLALDSESDFSGEFLTRNLDGVWYVSESSLIEAAAAALNAPFVAAPAYEGPPLRIIPLELVPDYAQSGWQWYDLWVAFENRGEEVVPLNVFDLGNVHLETEEGYNYAVEINQYDLPHTLDWGNHYFSGEYVMLPPHFRTRGRVDDGISRFNFHMAAGEKTHPTQLVFEGGSIVDVNGNEEVQYPTDLPNSSFRDLPDTITIGDAEITLYRPYLEDIKGGADSFKSLSFDYEIQNLSVGADTQVSVWCFLFDGTGYFHISGMGGTVGPGVTEVRKLAFDVGEPDILLRDINEALKNAKLYCHTPDVPIYNIDIENSDIEDAASDVEQAQVEKPQYGVPVELIVQAEKAWQDSGVVVSQGDSVHINYLEGEWSVCPPGCRYTDGDGWYTSDRWETPEESENWPDNVLSGCPHGALIVRTSDDIFCVGNSVTIEVSSDAVVEFRINDETIGDNGGAVRIQVEVR